MSIITRRFITISKNQIFFLTNNYFNTVVTQKPITQSSTQPVKTLLTSSKCSHQRFVFQSSNEKKCWNCKAEIKKISNFICDKCRKLQDISEESDFFELLSLPRDFDIPSTKLTKIFRQLQTLVHPDKFGNKTEREQANSAEWSALINKAYKTLSHPLVRGQYLLKLHGVEMPHDNSALNKEFLLEMMEKNEEVDEAVSIEDLNSINEKIQEEIDSEIGKLKALFASNDLNGAKAVLVKMKYLMSIQSSIQAKLEKLVNG
ncbi:iron-sulfur cluster co-chaperone protein HscB [Episyrphus balteatus]|uniref:iron-sulfur cluster co-chaperone protein HscB n=1 Tax=Episyrphus balteatus TaxID=286459 RepID=UPI0024865E77|nr:iron-sulfur cluster co-chaperone protein HscB [Episyrphus balteatus]